MSFMKYIVVQDSGFEEMFIFSNTRQHVDVANCLSAKQIVSAGQCIIDGEFSRFIGDSISLGVCSRPQDHKLFLKQFGDY